MRTWIGISVVACVAFTACADDASSPTEVMGGTQAMYGGTVSTYAVLQDGIVLEVGLTIPSATVAGGAAAEPGTYDGFPIEFPPEAQAQTVINHELLEFDHDTATWWMHYVFISNTTRLTVMCPQDAAIDAAEIPAQYALGGPAEGDLCYSGEGRHAADLTGPDAQVPPQPLTHSMWIGYVAGDLAFLEPTISNDLLASHTGWQEALRQPMVYPAIASGKLYPTKYTATFANDAWRLAFTDFTAIP